MTFALFDFDFNSKKSAERDAALVACDLLNSLTEEQKAAVEFYGQSKYSQGCYDTEESNYWQNQE